MAHPASKAGRDDRLYPDKPSDPRTPGQRDRDRILYTSAFRRLGGVTQVVASDEGHVFHNRLTHSLEVAQFGRRLAERLIKEDSPGTQRVGGIDPDVVEAACLAHDLGHPPFGHIAENELDDLVVVRRVPGGFDGNAQSFRIVTKLSLQSPNMVGLNLTRATLHAILKYPWLRSADGKQHFKWGAYQTESQELDWATALQKRAGQKSPEANLMDWADDVTYAVHDATDFYRAGLVPLDRLASTNDSAERKRFVRAVFERHRTAGLELPYPAGELEDAFNEAIVFFPLDEPYRGTEFQRSNLRRFTSGLISRHIAAVSLNDPEGVLVDPERDKEVFMWKQLTWHYVILNPALVTQQYGQRKIIRDLFEIFLKSAASDDAMIFPEAYRELLKKAASNDLVVRLVADLISSFSEQQAVNLHRRLTGVSLGSVLDHIDLA